MNPYIKSLNTYLTAHPLHYGHPNIDSLLGMLYRIYTDANPIDTPALRNFIHNINDYLSPLPLNRQAAVWDTIFQVYQEMEQSAFLEGLHVGLHLSRELTE